MQVYAPDARSYPNTAGSLKDGSTAGSGDFAALLIKTEKSDDNVKNADLSEKKKSSAGDAAAKTTQADNMLWETQAMAAAAASAQSENLNAQTAGNPDSAKPMQNMSAQVSALTQPGTDDVAQVSAQNARTAAQAQTGRTAEGKADAAAQDARSTQPAQDINDALNAALNDVQDVQKAQAAQQTTASKMADNVADTAAQGVQNAQLAQDISDATDAASKDAQNVLNVQTAQQLNAQQAAQSAGNVTDTAAQAVADASQVQTAQQTQTAQQQAAAGAQTAQQTTASPAQTAQQMAAQNAGEVTDTAAQAVSEAAQSTGDVTDTAAQAVPDASQVQKAQQKVPPLQTAQQQTAPERQTVQQSAAAEAAQSAGNVTDTAAQAVSEAAQTGQQSQTAQQQAAAGAQTAQQTTASPAQTAQPQTVSKTQTAQQTTVSETVQITDVAAASDTAQAVQPDRESAFRRETENRGADSSEASDRKADGAPEIVNAAEAQLRSESLFAKDLSTTGSTQTAEITTTRATLTEDLAGYLAAHFPQKNGTFQIELNPQNLGRVMIRVVYETGRAVVSIAASQAETVRMLSQNAQQMGNILRDATGEETTVVVPEVTQQKRQDDQTNTEARSQNRREADENPNRGKNRRSRSEEFLTRMRLGMV